ncbi:hypothetical protein TI03_06935 [Achromatium sp. WMS1]|nr:hypothetical protein TI03_06935 [Achromatium sp. WMS1]
MQGSEQLYQWLDTEKISVVFSTYQTNRLLLLGCKDNGHLAVNERLFDKPMGLYAKDEGASNLNLINCALSLEKYYLFP